MISGEQAIFEARMYRDALDAYKDRCRAFVQTMQALRPAFDSFYKAMEEAAKTFNRVMEQLREPTGD